MSIINEKSKIKIIFALDKATGAAPMGYISKHSGIEDPIKLLRQLEKDGLVRQLPPGLWNPSLNPLFELTGKAKKLLKQSIDLQIERFVEILA